MTACSHHDTLPPFTATGYLADLGTVRIWQKASPGDNTHILAAFTPWRSQQTMLGDYRWQNNQLVMITLTLPEPQAEQVEVRFADKGEVSFMQRVIGKQKQPVSSEDIALYQYRATQLKAVSAALRVGGVVLHQGVFEGKGNVMTCEGQQVSPAFDDSANRYIAQQAAEKKVYISWLEAPAGSQLLLVSYDNVCRWQPDPKTF